MTKEEIISHLLHIQSRINMTFRTMQEQEEYEALDMAIKALSQESTDAISREMALKECHDIVVDGERYRVIQEETLLGLPPVTQKSKTAHWIRITNGAMKEKYICSECGRQIEDDGIEGLLPIKYPYCHCGAKMESEDKE